MSKRSDSKTWLRISLLRMLLDEISLAQSQISENIKKHGILKILWILFQTKDTN